MVVHERIENIVVCWEKAFGRWYRKNHFDNSDSTLSPWRLGLMIEMGIDHVNDPCLGQPRLRREVWEHLLKNLRRLELALLRVLYRLAGGQLVRPGGVFFKKKHMICKLYL